jgi:hypothetical protein
MCSWERINVRRFGKSCTQDDGGPSGSEQRCEIVVERAGGRGFAAIAA